MFVAKIPWYPKLLFQREKWISLVLSAEGLGNSTKTLPGRRNLGAGGPAIKENE
jgi:hypothetical protein